MSGSYLGYTYVENKPINYTDPTGHKKLLPTWLGWCEKTAREVVSTGKSVVRKVVNTVSNVWGGVKQAASYVYNGVRNTYNRAVNYFSGGGSSGGGQTIYLGSSGNGSGSSTSQGFMTHEQLVAVQTAQRQQRLDQEYQKATGSKGKPKTKEALNMVKNWGKSVKETWTKFCKTAPKVVKSAAKTGVSFGVGFVVQVLDNNDITLPITSWFSQLADKDWVKNNKGYNADVFVGKLSGLCTGRCGI